MNGPTVAPALVHQPSYKRYGRRKNNNFGTKIAFYGLSVAWRILGRYRKRVHGQEQ